jgi:hypothetical protein
LTNDNRWQKENAPFMTKMKMLTMIAQNIMMMKCMSIIIIPLLPIPISIIYIMTIRSGIITHGFIWAMIGITHVGTDPSGTDPGGAGHIDPWATTLPGIAGIIRHIIIPGVLMMHILMSRQ